MSTPSSTVPVMSNTPSPSSHDRDLRYWLRGAGRVFILVAAAGMLLVFLSGLDAQLTGDREIRGWPPLHLAVVLTGLLLSAAAFVFAAVGPLARLEKVEYGRIFVARWVLLACAVGALALYWGGVYGGATATQAFNRWFADNRYRDAEQSFIALETCAAQLGHLGETHPGNTNAVSDKPPTSADAAEFVVATQEYVTAAICVAKNLREATILVYEDGGLRMPWEGPRDLGPDRGSARMCPYRSPQLRAADAALWEQERRWGSVEQWLLGTNNLDATAMFEAITERPVLPALADHRPFWGESAGADGAQPWVTVDPDKPYALTVTKPTLQQARDYCVGRSNLNAVAPADTSI